MYLRKYFHVVTFAALLATFFTLTAMAGSDLAIYSGPTNPGWITDNATRREADEMLAGLKGMFEIPSQTILMAKRMLLERGVWRIQATVR